MTERAARTLIAAAPYRETGYRYLMQALAERGRVAEALQRVRRRPPSCCRTSSERRRARDCGRCTSGCSASRGSRPQTERDDPLAVGLGHRDAALHRSGRARRTRARRRAARAHARLLRHAAAAQGGSTFAGDELVVFRRPRDGLGCAVALQQAVAAHNARHPGAGSAVRVALHCGEPMRKGDEHAGRAGRAGAAPLRARRSRARSWRRRRCAPRRARAALPRPRRRRAAPQLEVVWDPVARAAVRAAAGVLRRPRADALVGREPDLERLWGALRADKRRSLPGRALARRAGDRQDAAGRRARAARARGRAPIVLYGRCDEEPLLAPPAVRRGAAPLRGRVPARRSLRDRCSASSGELRRLVPELGGAARRSAPSRWPATRRASATGCSRPSAALLCEAARARPGGARARRPALGRQADAAAAAAPRPLIRARRGCSCSAPTATPSLTPATRSSRRSPSSAASTRARAHRARGRSTPRPSRRSSASHAGDARRPSSSQIALRARPRATRSSSSRCCATSRSRAHRQPSGGRRPARRGRRPEGVKDVIGRRVARLGRRTRRVLAIAAVSGRELRARRARARRATSTRTSSSTRSRRRSRARVIEEVAGGRGPLHVLARADPRHDLRRPRARRGARSCTGAWRGARGGPRGELERLPRRARAPLRPAGLRRRPRQGDRVRRARRRPRGRAARLRAGGGALPPGRRA